MVTRPQVDKKFWGIIYEKPPGTVPTFFCCGCGEETATPWHLSLTTSCIHEPYIGPPTTRFGPYTICNFCRSCARSFAWEW